MEQQQSAATMLSGATATDLRTLEGHAGRLRFELHDGAARTFEVKNGMLQPSDGSEAVDSVIGFDTEETLVDVLSGRKNPVVMALQGRLRIVGNLELATRVLFGLQARRVGGEPTGNEVPS